jgi:hypothetical protein
MPDSSGRLRSKSGIIPLLVCGWRVQPLQVIAKLLTGRPALIKGAAGRLAKRRLRKLDIEPSHGSPPR